MPFYLWVYIPSGTWNNFRGNYSMPSKQRLIFHSQKQKATRNLWEIVILFVLPTVKYLDTYCISFWNWFFFSHCLICFCFYNYYFFYSISCLLFPRQSIPINKNLIYCSLPDLKFVVLQAKYIFFMHGKYLLILLKIQCNFQ